MPAEIHPIKEEDDLEDLFSKDLDLVLADIVKTGGTDLDEYLSDPDILKNLDQISNELEEDILMEEGNVLENFTNSISDFEKLDNEITICDNALASISEVISKFQTNLTNISEEIQQLQRDSLMMNTRLRNRRAANDLLSVYVEGLIISQDLAKNICELDCGDTSYIPYLLELSKKLESIKRMETTLPGNFTQSELQSHQGGGPTHQELERLLIKAASKVHLFLIQKIQTLKKPKTNLQILQQNVLLRYHYFNHFLQSFAPQQAKIVHDSYIQTMSKVYSYHFKTYHMSLSKLQLEWAPHSGDLIVPGPNKASSSSGMMGGSDLVGNSIQGFQAAGKFFLEALSINTDAIMMGTTQLKEKQNVFSLTGRAELIKELDQDPIVAHMVTGGQKFYPEALFRSIQKLLVDTSSTEFSFCCEWFGNEEGKRIFKETFEKTLHFFHEMVLEYVSNSWDSVGLLMQIRVIEYYKAKMEERKLSILSNYFDRLLVDLWPRLRYVLDQNCQSLREFTSVSSTTSSSTSTTNTTSNTGNTTPTTARNISSTGGGSSGSTTSNMNQSSSVSGGSNNVTSQNTLPATKTGLLAPHIVTRRYVELMVSISKLKCPVKTPNKPDQILISNLASMDEAIERQLEIASGSIKDQDQRKIFLINNLDLIVTVAANAQLSVQHWRDAWTTQCQAFTESQIRIYFPEMIEFVQANENTKDSAGNMILVSSDSVRQSAERVSKHFQSTWKQVLASVYTTIMNSFCNLENAGEILKQCLTQILLYYTRYNRVLTSLNLTKAVQHYHVNNTIILTEIKNYSKDNFM